MFGEYENSNENAKGVVYPGINDAKLMAAYISISIHGRTKAYRRKAGQTAAIM